MRTFIPTSDFTGFPDGNHKHPVKFKAGKESPPVPEPYLQLMFDKGLVDEKQTPKRPISQINAPKPAVARKFARATQSRRSGKASRQSSED